MKHKTMFLGTVLILALLASGAALAAVEAGYDLSWWTSDGGGGTSGSAGYTLSGAIGQPDAGSLLTGPGYQLSSGFWGSASNGPPQYFFFLPLISR